MGNLDRLVLLLLTLAQMSRSGDITHKTIVLANNLSGSVYTMAIEGATVMADEYYTDDNLAKTVGLMPFHPDWYLQLQFVYLDLPGAKPCQDRLSICETQDGYTHFCRTSMVDEFCGTLDDLFPSGRYDAPRYLTTSRPGHSILITWKTSRPSGFYRGFQLIVTAYKKSPCQGPDVWQCAGGNCISPSLHCDNIAHCTDASDELINCNNTGFLVPSVADCTLFNSKECPSTPWQERWFGLAIPMVIVMVLLFVATFVRVRKMMCSSTGGESSPSRSRCRRFRRHGSNNAPRGQSDANNGVPAGSTMARESLTGSCDGHTLLLMPPPYSPPGGLGYTPPIPGEPPPVYEESLSPQYQEYKPEFMSSSTDQSQSIIPSAPPLTPQLIRTLPPSSESEYKPV